MASHFVSPAFVAANPSHSDLTAIRAAMVARLDHEMGQAQISRRCEEIGMSGQTSTIGIYLAAHGFEAARTDAERWFVMGFDAYRALAYDDVNADAHDALFGGRWPLMSRQPAVVAEPMRLAA